MRWLRAAILHSAFFLLHSLCGGFDGMRDFHAYPAFHWSAVSLASIARPGGGGSYPRESQRYSLPLAGQGESGPEVWAGEILRVQQGQLRFPPGFRAGLAGAPAADEFRHQLAGGLVAHFPMARQHGLRAGDAEGPPLLARGNALAVTKRSNPLRAQQLCLREDRLYGLLLQVGRVAVFVQDALHHDFDLGTSAFAEGPVDGHALPHFGD